MTSHQMFAMLKKTYFRAYLIDTYKERYNIYKGKSLRAAI
jgi:hypothetical protein